MLFYKILTSLILLFFINSCVYESDRNLCPKYSIDTTVYQCHNPNAKNFSFLSKYKKLESLDLTGTAVKDLSFLNKLFNLKTLLLIETQVDSFEYIIKLKKLEKVFLNKTPLDKFYNIFKFNQYNSVDLYLLKDNSESFFSLLRNKKQVNLLKYVLGNILGVTQLTELKVLKLHLKTDKYIKILEKNLELEELYLSGNIKELPDFRKLKKLKVLFLYNTKITDFSFLLNSNIDSLHISTRDFKDKKWLDLMNKYSNVDIYMNNMFTIRDCNKKLPSLLPYESTKGLTFRVMGACWDGYGGLASDIIDFNFRLQDTKFLIKKVGINYIWSNNKTFLDNALKYKNKKVINYLKSLKAKRGCEVLKIECEDI